MTEQKVISFHYTVKNTKGEVLDSSQGQDPMTVLTGTQQIIPGLENALVKMAEGESQNLDIKAAEAYGARSENLIQEVARTELPEELSIGQMFTVSTDESGEPSHVVTVTAFDDSTVTLDANHPLAGQDLTFDVSVESMRAATPSEIEHKHVHHS